MRDYKCSVCGAGALYDGRCGDGPVLTCNCNRGEWIDDGRGGYYDNPTNAKPVKGRGIKDGKRTIIIIRE